MFWEYWKLKCSPFDNVPDPRMYCDRNPSLEDAISEVLFAVEEGNDCLAVMLGDIGLGKTLALRIIMDELAPERYRVVSVTNPALTFVQILREIVGQLKGEPTETRFKDALQEEFNRLLFETAAEGKRVVIMIDEANALSRHVLQNLRLLTNMQDDDKNLVSIILAGQLELAKKLEARGMENLFQRIGVYCHIKGLETTEMVRDYVEFRMGRAGATEPVFGPEALEEICIHSRGVPRLVNKLCKLALKAGETNGLTAIDGELITKIASMFEKGKVCAQEAEAEAEVPAEAQAAPEAAVEESAPEPEEETAEPGEVEAPAIEAEPEPAAEVDEPAPPEAEAPVAVEAGAATAQAEPAGPPLETCAWPRPEAGMSAPEQAAEPGEARGPAEVLGLEAASASPEPAPLPAPRPQRPAPAPQQRPVARPAVLKKAARGPQQHALTGEQLEQIIAGLPGKVLEQVGEMDDQQVVKLAGELAAKQMWQHEKAIRLSHGDPIDFWERSRAQIASRLRELGSQKVFAAG